MHKRITYDEWVATYKPIPNKFEDKDNFGYETYGEEEQYVLLQDEAHVWTEMDGDNGVYIVDGFHWVNRIQHYITTVPITDNTSVEVPICVYKECGDGAFDCGPFCPNCEGDGYTTEWILTQEDLDKLG